MFKDPMIRKSVYASVIAAVFVIIFVQPIMNYLGQFFVWLGELLYQRLSDSFYMEAAVGLVEKYSFTLFALFMGIITGAIVGATTFTLIRSGRETKEKKSPMKSKFVMAILAGVLLILSIYLLSLNFAAFQMNASFAQRKHVIRPLIEDTKFFEIEAKWAMMTSKKDYEAINQEMERIAEAKKITLPKLLWK